jgi:glycosyltransferase involved in cell wall biosynthesis
VKVLQVHNRYRQAGGEDTVVARERELLMSAGHEVLQFQVENPPGALGAAATLLVSAWNPSSAGRVKQVAAEFQPDVAHIHNTWWLLSPSVIGALGSVPTVMTLHNYRLLCANAQLFRDGHPCEDCVGRGPWQGVRHRCYRGSLPASMLAASAIAIPRRWDAWRNVDLFLALTDFAKDRFVAGGLPERKLLVKPNFVDDCGPRPVPPSESRTVLFVGRLSVEKGIDILLDAWGRACPDGLELVVVGDGPLASELRRSSPAGVRLLGRLGQQQVSELMLSARALVFPSIWYEGQPMVLLEALAAGLPLVVSSIGGLPDSVVDERAALMVGQRSEWAKSLSGLVDDRWVDEAGHRARAVYEEHYGPTAALDRLLDAYRRAGARS